MQESWVLMSGSADQAVAGNLRNLHTIQKDDELKEARKLNNLNPTLITQEANFATYKRKRFRPAILITGQLRCLNKSRLLIKKLSRSSDIFIVTTKKYKREALSISSRKQTFIVEENHEAAMVDSNLPFNTMKQWHKLAIGLELIELEEKKAKKRYTHILKIRSDYYFAHPENILQDLRGSSNSSRGLVGASDKVFGGRRDYMMLMKGFFDGILGWQMNMNNIYWPIALDQILNSDESIKWYGFNWPKDLIGTPKTVDELRNLLLKNYSVLKRKLQLFKPDAFTTYHKLFIGNEDFASEVAFARHLNLVGIPFNECYGLRGFLYKNRR